MRVVDTGVENTFISPIDKFGRTTNEQILVVAKCISQDSSVKTPFGNIQLKNIELNKEFQIISFNIDERKKEIDTAIKVNSGIKEVYEIETKSRNKIRASKDHVFFVLQNGKIIEKKLEELKIGEKIIIA